MANNCDYCHKPLSLMRRLRGEQFCSVEHLDAYSAQQAEFALERLAASVTDKPNTERPPALVRPMVRPIANPSEAAPVAVAERVRRIADSYEAATNSVAEVAVPQEHEATVRPLMERLLEPQYPMAPYLDQSEIPPRELENIEERELGFASEYNWGRTSAGWSMPPFRSEPSDPRTWNAGKLVAQVPPAAAWRLLLAPAAWDEEAAETETNSKGTLLRNSGTIAALLQSTPSPVWRGLIESAREGFAAPRNRLTQAERVVTRLHPQGWTFEWDLLSGAQFLPGPVGQGTVPFEGASAVGLQVAVPHPLALQAKAPDSSSELEGGQALGAAPQVVWPHPNVWGWTQTLSAPPVAMPEPESARMDVAGAKGSTGWQLTPGAVRGPVPQADEWHRTLSLGVPKVAMPALDLARMDAAGVTGFAGWHHTEGTVRGPIPQWAGSHLGSSGANFGWESSPAQQIAPEASLAIEADRIESTLVSSDFAAGLYAGLPPAGPCLWRRWSVPKAYAFTLQVGPVLNTATDTQRLPLLPFQVDSLRLGKRLVPPGSAAVRSTLRLVEPPRVVPAIRTKIPQMGPVKYSPVAIVVVPPPRFALKPAAITDEQRYVAQSPNGVWRLPRVRHTGYRALGPFPKLPLRMPDGYLRPSDSAMPPPVADILPRPLEVQQNLAGLPQFAAPSATHIHPADYLAWPQPKGMMMGRILPERVSGNHSAPSIKRFGPGKAGLQGRGRNVDGLARA